MVREPEDKTYKDRLRELGLLILKKKEAKKQLFTVFRYPVGGSREDRA